MTTILLLVIIAIIAGATASDILTGILFWIAVCIIIAVSVFLLIINPTLFFIIVGCLVLWGLVAGAVKLIKKYSSDKLNNSLKKIQYNQKINYKDFKNLTNNYKKTAFAITKQAQSTNYQASQFTDKFKLWSRLDHIMFELHYKHFYFYDKNHSVWESQVIPVSSIIVKHGKFPGEIVDKIQLSYKNIKIILSPEDKSIYNSKYIENFRRQ